MITTDQLSKISPNIPLDLSEKVAPLLSDIFPLYISIDTQNVFEEFLPNILVESNSFQSLTESLNYQAIALTLKFSRNRISVDDCYKYGRTMKQRANQQMIANILYGGAWGKLNLGNISPTDGWDFRGSGPMQITGRYLGEKFRSFYNSKFLTTYTLFEVFKKLRSDLSFGIHAACWLFIVEKKLANYAVDDNMLAIRKSINGGTFGLSEVNKFYATLKNVYSS